MKRYVLLFALATIALAHDTFFRDRVVENGFKFEEHTVATEDGYYLTLFRIPSMEG